MNHLKSVAIDFKACIYDWKRIYIFITPIPRAMDFEFAASNTNSLSARYLIDHIISRVISWDPDD